MKSLSNLKFRLQLFLGFGVDIFGLDVAGGESIPCPHDPPIAFFPYGHVARRFYCGLSSMSTCLSSFIRCFSPDLAQGAEAQTLARRDIRTRFPNPYYWAVFILHGDG
ncbi:MAG: hypothetical protein K9K88_09895 [Desulfobacterales bacterium]|nr:hypothetical protein [Desulfobacterales bacterium]